MAEDNGGNSPGTGAAEKALALDALNRSVIETPKEILRDSSSYVLWIAASADGITPWGLRPTLRDKELRDFWPTEHYFASALGLVCARNAAFSWAVEGSPRSRAHAHDMLLSSNLGMGYESLIIQTSIDLYTQDRGAFIEIVRADDDPRAPVLNLNHLDAARSHLTGNPRFPVIYEDTLGRWHILKWYQVIHLREMPSPVEARAGPFAGLQYCALTRALKATQTMRNISVYFEEKTGGRFNRAIHLIKGVSKRQIDDALGLQEANADSQGLTRYMQPLIVSTIDPRADVGHDTLELASLPSGFNEEITIRNYWVALAMAFGVDIQDLAPLPGGNLGSSQQSYILHLKSKGKGPALFMKLIAHTMNANGILPRNVTFVFREQDIREEQEKAELARIRAQERQIRILSGELTPEAARQLALDAGDLPREVFDALGGFDMTPAGTTTDVE